MLVLVGDLGGTKTDLVLYERMGITWMERASERYASHAFESFDHALMHFCSMQNATIDAACFAMAGPVRNGQGTLTNLSWHLDERALRDKLGTERVHVINDFEALAWGLFALSPGQTAVLQTGQRQSDGVVAVMGAGTGLGKAYGVMTSHGPRVFPTEGGHVELAPRNAIEDGFARWLRDTHGRASLEHALSGNGLAAMYRYFHAMRPQSVDVLRDAAAQDAPRIVTEAALAASDGASVQALDLFCAFYASALGDFALSVMPRGGLYVGGGIAPKILARMRTPPFVQTFKDKAPMNALLETIPLEVILDPRVALAGARTYAFTAR